MKRLWLILFVIVPLIGQGNPCENAKYLALKAKVQTYEIISLNDEETDDYIFYNKRCRNYMKNIDEMEEAERTRQRQIKEMEEAERTRQRQITRRNYYKKQNEQIEKQNEQREKQYEQSLKSEKSEQEDFQLLEGFLNSLINTVDDNQSSNPFSGKSSGRTCQYDDNELRKTFDRKLESGKIAYKWECVPLGTHTYWIVE